MSELTADNAAEALSAAWEADTAAAGNPTLPEQAPQPQDQQVPSGDDNQGATESSDSFTNIDPTTLAPELQEIYRQMQGDYTRKTQEASPWRKLGEEFGVDPDSARQALEFVDGLNDPDNLVTLHSQISEYLQANGFSKAEADAAAADQVQAQVDDFNDDDYGITDPRVDALQRELQELKQFRDQIQEERQLAEIDSALQRQESIIRQENPNLTDDDVKDIYRLSYAYGANLLEAAKAFETMKNRFIGDYVNSKASAVPSSVAPPSAGGHSQRPDRFTDLDSAHEFAKQYAKALESEGAFSA